LVPVESSHATSHILVINTDNLPHLAPFWDIAFNRSKIALFGNPSCVYPRRKQAAQLSQGGQSGRLELGDNIYGHYKSIFQPLWRCWPAKQSNSAKNAK